MSRKFVSLIHGGELRPAPNTKILKSEEFSSLLSAEEMLEKVKSDAEQYRREVADECETVKDKACREGFEEGLKQWAEKIAELEKEIENLHTSLNDMIVPIALQAAKKIIGREMELNREDTVVSIVSENLKAVSQHKKIKVFVHKDDFEYLEKNKQKLRDLFEHLESLSLAAREDIESGGCIIETEGGIINAQLENKWQILEQAFASLMKGK